MVPQSSTYKMVQNNVCKIEYAHHFQLSQRLDQQHKLVQNNVCKIEYADHFQVSQPLDQQHASYKRLLQFIQEDLGHHFQVSQPLDQQHASYVPWKYHFDREETERYQALIQQHASNKRLRPALTYLPRYVSWRNYLKFLSIERS